MIRNIFLVAIGGGAGSSARYLMQKWIYQLAPHVFPWGTFLVNVFGCLLIGIFWGLGLRSAAFHEGWKLLLMTGLCGGFTTFSTFALESYGLLNEQRTGILFLYVAGSVLLCLLATFVGILITK
jgi:CrcB protein